MKEISSSEEFIDLIKQGKPMLVDFYADWCGPCQMLMPILESLSERHSKDVVIAKVNVDVQQDLASMMQVRSIPALFFFKEGKMVEQLRGVQSTHVIDQKISALKAA